jgi:hypothetical protein
VNNWLVGVPLGYPQCRTHPQVSSDDDLCG